jgi:hypothetical protein
MKFSRPLGLVLAAFLGCIEAAGTYVGISEANPTGSSAIAPEGLVAAFDFETLTADGRLKDFSTHGNHGSLNRRIATEGLFGEAMVFDSVADRIHLREDASLDLSGPLSIAVWVRVNELDLHQHVLACDDKYALWVTPANQFRLGDTRGGGYSTAEGSIETGRWYSVVAVLGASQGDTLQPGDVEMYVDGEPASASIVLRGQATERPAATWGSAELYPEDACYIGFESHQGNEAHQAMPFKGVLDEALVFGRVLTLAEVQAHAARRSRD